MNNEPLGRGETAAAISSGIVSLLRDYTGRGPTKARTAMSRDTITVILTDGLTKAERKLADHGRTEYVLDARHQIQRIMSDDCHRDGRDGHRSKGPRLHERQPHRPGHGRRGLRARASGRTGRLSGLVDQRSSPADAGQWRRPRPPRIQSSTSACRSAGSATRRGSGWHRSARRTAAA